MKKKIGIILAATAVLVLVAQAWVLFIARTNLAEAKSDEIETQLKLEAAEAKLSALHEKYPEAKNLEETREEVDRCFAELDHLEKNSRDGAPIKEQ